MPVVSGRARARGLSRRPQTPSVRPELQSQNAANPNPRASGPDSLPFASTSPLIRRRGPRQTPPPRDSETPTPRGPIGRVLRSESPALAPPPPHGPPARPQHLRPLRRPRPLQLTPSIGRDDDLADQTRLLQYPDAKPATIAQPSRDPARPQRNHPHRRQPPASPAPTAAGWMSGNAYTFQRRGLGRRRSTAGAVGARPHVGGFNPSALMNANSWVSKASAGGLLPRSK